MPSDHSSRDRLTKLATYAATLMSLRSAARGSTAAIGVTLLSLSLVGCTGGPAAPESAPESLTPQTISFGPLQNVTYGVPALTLTGTVSSGLPVSYVVMGPATVSGSVLSITGAGNVTITAIQVGNADTAPATPVVQTFGVAPAPLTVTAQDTSRVYGAANSNFTVSYSGFVNGDAQATAITGSPNLTTNDTINSPVGNYPITVTRGTLAAANYTLNFIDGTLVVLQASVVLTWASPDDLVPGTALGSAQLNASASVPGSFTYTPPAGTVLGEGAGQDLHVQFTPTDSADYSTATRDVSINVVPDTTPPTVPTGVTTTAILPAQVNLSWNASTDNVAVQGYIVFRNGARVAATNITSYKDIGLAASTKYFFSVAAYDSAGNISAPSDSISAITQDTRIPAAIGWYDIPNTTLQSVCPPNNFGNSGYAFSDSCAAVISAWGGGMADSTRNRLVIWGGGHTDYAGNEIYALDLNSLTMLRLNDPALPLALASSCPQESLTGPSPNSRHTTDQLSYIAHADVMLAVTGSLAPCGAASQATWTFSPRTMQWTQMIPTGPAPDYNGGIAASDYDPNTKNAFIHTESYGTFSSYNFDSNTYTQLATNQHTDYHMTGITDPKRRLFFLFGGDVNNGGGVKVVDISGVDPSYITNDWTSQVSGCGPIMTAPYPGLAYDPVQNRIVGWAGGDAVYVFDPDTKSCTSVTYSNGPGAQQQNGTNKRFRYFPGFGVFVLINDAGHDAYALRLTPGSPEGPNSAPSIFDVTSRAISTSAATITWNTDVSATSQIEYGATTAYGMLTVLDPNLDTDHLRTLIGLSPKTEYHYRVISVASNGVNSISDDFAFVTLDVPDTTPPTILITSPANNATISGTVTISADASDNVGVSRVQFVLGGANLGSAIAPSPYSIAWDTTTSANGTYILTAQAFDAAGNVGNAAPVTVTISNDLDSILQDFPTRCAQLGVVVCQGFDDPLVFAPAVWPASGLYPGDTTIDGTNYLGTFDSTVTASGAGGSLKFTVPSLGGSEASGYWRQLFTSSLAADPSQAQQFGENSTFYVQFHQRFSPEFLTNQWPSIGGGLTYWKQEILSNDTATCASVELTTVNLFNEGFPSMYSQCGSDSLWIGLSNNDFLLEQGDTSNTGYNCHYQNRSAQTCFMYPANTWVTFYYKVSIGHWGQPDSTIQAWVAVNGQPYQEWINITNHILLEDVSQQDYDMITLFPYMTGRDNSVSAGPTAYTWYDELIVSTNPIAAPKQ